LIVARGQIVTAVAVGGVLICVTILIVPAPIVFTVSDAGAIAFLVSGIHSLPQLIGAVLIDLVIGATAVVPVNGSRVLIRIVIEIMTLRSDTLLLLAKMLVVILLKSVLRHPPLLLEHS